MTNFKVETIIEFDPSDLDGMRTIMDQYHTLDTSVYGKNESGEMTMMSIYEDKIIIETFQSNKWIRKNTYHRDGWTEETFDGKWDI